MKLKLKGYVLRRCDTNEYLKELISAGNLSSVTWTSLDSDANLFTSKYDVMIAGHHILDAIKIVMKSSQRFKFENDLPKFHKN